MTSQSPIARPSMGPISQRAQTNLLHPFLTFVFTSRWFFPPRFLKPRTYFFRLRGMFIAAQTFTASYNVLGNKTENKSAPFSATNLLFHLCACGASLRLKCGFYRCHFGINKTLFKFFREKKRPPKYTLFWRFTASAMRGVMFYYRRLLRRQRYQRFSFFYLYWNLFFF